jgi:hypothetical protein
MSSTVLYIRDVVRIFYLTSRRTTWLHFLLKYASLEEWRTFMNIQGCYEKQFKKLASLKLKRKTFKGMLSNAENMDAIRFLQMRK